MTDFDKIFAGLVRITGWGLGVYVIVTGRVMGVEAVGLIITFVGFEFVSRARERALPTLMEKKNGS